jgi:hypothetical protein
MPVWISWRHLRPSATQPNGEITVSLDLYSATATIRGRGECPVVHETDALKTGAILARASRRSDEGASHTSQDHGERRSHDYLHRPACRYRVDERCGEATGGHLAGDSKAHVW